MSFATNNDLFKIAPEVFEHGIDDWTTELEFGSEDTINYIKVEYWNNHHSSFAFDSTLLDQTQWVKANVYRALSNYILPKMATFRVEDVFVEQIKFYSERFNEEMKLQFNLGIGYDSNLDGNVSEDEITTYKQDRLYR